MTADEGYARQPAGPVALIKRGILAAVQRLGYRVIPNDYFDRERRAVGEAAQRAIARERDHCAREIDKARRSAAEVIDAAGTAEDEARQFLVAPLAPEACRPLMMITEDAAWGNAPAAIEALAAFISALPAFREVIVPWFSDYPRRSFVSDHGRAYLYSLIRARRPARVLEIGTLHAGTTEVIARALYENDAGVVHTVDPFGAARAPRTIKRWPARLRAIVDFSAVNSMAFLARSADLGRQFDLVLVDGNHDIEFAAFDIAMSARLIPPGGLLVVDNAEQSGPFHAARQFAADNPDWTWLNAGRDLAPFESVSSLPETNFLVLQSPFDIVVRTLPRAWTATSSHTIAGFSLKLADEARGTLHYRVTLRAFGNAASRIDEFKVTGTEVIAGGGLLEVRLPEPLTSPFPQLFPDAHHVVEIELAWDGAGPLRLTAPPAALA